MYGIETYGDSVGSLGEIIALFTGVLLIPTIIIGILTLIAMWKIYSKAGEPGWAAIIPFYNLYVLFKITWGNGIMFLLMLIPIVNIIIYIVTLFKLAKVFGKGTGFGVGLLFLSTIFILILGLGNSQYVGLQQPQQ